MATEILNMIQVDSTGRNSGKTTLAEAFVKQHQEVHSIYDLKIITISDQRGVCQQDTKGYGICTNITAGYELAEEQEMVDNEDTTRLLVAGCQKVFLLKVFQGSLVGAIQQFLKAAPAQALIICEPNSLRNVVQSGLPLMMNNQNRRKELTRKVIDKADFCLLSTEISKKLRIYHQGEQLQVSLERRNKKECMH